MKILFVGNSFTYYNDMPAMLNTMAEKLEEDLHAEQITYGGYRLTWYTDPDNEHGDEVIPKLKEGGWDFVILQEQSKTPATDPSLFADGVARLMPHIMRNGARPVFYKTWAYQKDSDKLKDSGMGYEEMLAKLTASYDREAQRYGGLSVNAGTLFYAVQEDHPEINLYMPDNFHPNVAGSYLIAGLFLRLFTRYTPPKEYLPEGLSKEVAAVLREYM